MTRDEVIALAREAGYGEAMSDLHAPALERFAELIRDHLTYSDIHTCNPGCTKPPCVAMRAAEAHAAAVEREACAKVAEDATAAWTEHDHNDACMHIAAAIRSRT